MLDAKHLRGVFAMVPTPCKEDVAGWDVADSVDLEETARMAERLISAGIGGIALLWEDIQSVPPVIPLGEFPHFAEYNVQVEKVRVNASGYANVGPSRAPYRDLPEVWRAHAEASGKGWAELCRKYERAYSGG
jgi:dihydrodipicolinate synthase/N-acetylneuraminate lyase